MLPLKFVLAFTKFHFERQKWEHGKTTQLSSELCNFKLQILKVSIDANV